MFTPKYGASKLGLAGLGHTLVLAQIGLYGKRSTWSHVGPTIWCATARRRQKQNTTKSLYPPSRAAHKCQISAHKPIHHHKFSSSLCFLSFFSARPTTKKKNTKFLPTTLQIRHNGQGLQQYVLATVSTSSLIEVPGNFVANLQRNQTSRLPAARAAPLTSRLPPASAVSS